MSRALRCALLTGALLALFPALAAADTLSVSLTRADFSYPTPTELDGHVLDAAGAPLPGVSLELQSSAYPYRAFRNAGHATSGTDGSFSFPGLVPDRDTRYRVVEAASPQVASAAVTAIVEAPSVSHIYRLAYGFLQVTVLTYHTKSFNWGGQPAYWFIATRGSRHWHLTAVTRTHERKPGVTYMTLTFLPPLGRFDWRVCFNAHGERALGPPGAHGPCPHRDFTDRVPAP